MKYLIFYEISEKVKWQSLYVDGNFKYDQLFGWYLYFLKKSSFPAYFKQKYVFLIRLKKIPFRYNF